MKISDDQLDQSLRAAFQRKFEGFETQANPSAFERIMATLRPAGNRKYLFLALIFIAITVIGVLKKMNPNIAVPVASKQFSALSNPKKVTRPKQSQLLIKPDITTELANSKRLAKFEKMVLTNKKNQALIGFRVPEPKGFAENSKQITEPRFTESKLNNHHNNVPKIDRNRVYNEKSDIAPTPVFLPMLSTPDFLSKKFTEPLSVSLAAPKITLKEKTKHEPIVALTSKITWLFNISTLHTYQILTVEHSLANRYQNFSFPSGFSMESLGYKTSAGFERKNFQFLLHFNNFRQSVSYEIAENEYVIEPNNTGGYSVIRKGKVTNERKTFNLLGIGVNKQVVWGKASASKYYANAGLEYSHDLNSSQSIGWINAGIGKQFLVGKNTRLTAGPYAEFSPLKISGSSDPFYFQPYRVGLSIGIKLAQP